MTLDLGGFDRSIIQFVAHPADWSRVPPVARSLIRGRGSGTPIEWTKPSPWPLAQAPPDQGAASERFQLWGQCQANEKPSPFRKFLCTTLVRWLSEGRGRREDHDSEERSHRGETAG